MSFKTSGTYPRLPANREPSVSVTATLGVGSDRSVSSKPAATERRRPPNEPTRIFDLSSPATGDDSARAIGTLSRRTATFASPPFMPVPNAKSIALSVTKPKVDPGPPTQAPTAPRLRAFDDGRSRVTAWSTAQTVSAPVTEVAQAVAAADRKAASARTGAVDAERAKPRSPLGWFERLRLGPLTTRKLSILLLAMSAVVSGGSFAGRSIAKRGIVRGVTSAAAVASKPPVRSDTQATPPSPDRAIAAAPAEAPAPPSIDVEPEQAEPRAASDARSSHGVTLARQTVDALLAGDRATALLRYRELSRREPGHRVYREAVRLLASAPETP